MANKVLLKKSSVVARIPQPEDLEYGEVALNYADGRLYYKTSSNVIDVLSSASVADGNFSNTTINVGNVNINNQYQFPTTDGLSGQVLATNGAGQLIFADVTEGGVQIGGYNNSSLNGFPSGDYGDGEAFLGASAASFDAFGVSLTAIFTCMDPVGSLQTTDLGALT
jgi:hypothetical protein